MQNKIERLWFDVALMRSLRELEAEGKREKEEWEASEVHDAQRKRLEVRRPCLDCGSDLHGTDHPSCPEQHDCED